MLSTWAPLSGRFKFTFSHKSIKYSLIIASIFSLPQSRRKTAKLGYLSWLVSAIAKASRVVLTCTRSRPSMSGRKVVKDTGFVVVCNALFLSSIFPYTCYYFVKLIINDREGESILFVPVGQFIDKSLKGYKRVVF